MQFRRMEPTWIVTADSARARIFTVERPRGPLIELKDLVNPKDRLRERDLVSDRPGRERDRGGPGRSAMEHTDVKKHNAQTFAREVAEALTRSHGEGEFRRLYLAAAPDFLGQLRDQLHGKVADSIVQTLNKDIAHERADAIRKHLPERL